MARPKKIQEENAIDLNEYNFVNLKPVNDIGLYTVAIPKDKHERIQKIADFKKISVEKLIDLTLRELIAGRISI